jgi:hypothetical protein
MDTHIDYCNKLDLGNNNKDLNIIDKVKETENPKKERKKNIKEIFEMNKNEYNKMKNKIKKNN